MSNYSDKNIIWSAGGKFDFKTGIADQPAMGERNSKKYDGINQTTFCTGCATDPGRRFGRFQE